MYTIQAEDLTEVGNGNCGCLKAPLVPSPEVNDWCYQIANFHLQVTQYHPEECSTLLRVVSVSKLAVGITDACERAEL